MPLVISFRLERNAEPLDACRIAGFIEPYSCNADARIVAPRDEPRKQVERTIRATSGSRIQDTFGLERIAWFRLHDLPQALQLKATYRLSSSRSSGC